MSVRPCSWWCSSAAMVAEADRAATGKVSSGAMDPRLLQAIVLVVLAYLVGSIPMGVLVARLTGGVDPRTVGSGRTGGTNALRVSSVSSVTKPKPRG